MGGIAQFGLLQLSPDQQAALVHQTAPVPRQRSPSPRRRGIRAIFPISEPCRSTARLRAEVLAIWRRGQQPHSKHQTFLNQQQPQQRPGQYSPDNPHAKLQGG